MFIELHLLQNFPPHCLNRDDTNAPKDCTFGGHRRARISSQCIKRAIRQDFRSAGRLPDVDLAHRSKRVIRRVAECLVRDHGRDEAAALAKAAAALSSVKLTSDDARETQYLLFVGQREIDALVAAVDVHWDSLSADAPAPPAEDTDAGKAKKGKKPKKGDVGVPDEVRKSVLALLDGGKAADLALFGRMLADLPERNVDAACQVAHALSTNRVAMEMDFFTAVDDLKDRSAADSDAGAGAGMLGTVEFNSACFYRYANIDANQLLSNLGGDEDLTRKTIAAFLRSSFEAIPTGKQNSFAAHTPPSFVLAVVRERGLWSLANAFVNPVQPNHQTDLVTGSIEKLDGYLKALCEGLGDDGIASQLAFLLPVPGVEPKLDSLKDCRKSKFSDLVDGTLAAVRLDGGAGK